MRSNAAVALLLFAGVSVAAHAAETPIPTPLTPWVSWIQAQHPTLGCPLVGGHRVCHWPGKLALSLSERGGSFSLDVVADAPGPLLLPGEAAHWPVDVLDNGRQALATRLAAGPAILLTAGTHHVTGRFEWSRVPESLVVPVDIGLVEVAIDGERMGRVRREPNGTLWLAARAVEASEQDQLAVEVARRIDDGVPVTMTVRLKLRTSGQAREVEVGSPLPAGFEPVSLSSSVPVRLAKGDDGLPRLFAQLRPGEASIEVAGVSREPVTRLVCPEQSSPWPGEEFWVFAANAAVRTVQIEGAAGIAAERTPLPDDWKRLPAFHLLPGGVLEIRELERGQAKAPPDQMRVSRQLWLGFDGRRFVVEDHLSGNLYQGGRLEAGAPAELGRVAIAGQGEGEVITQGPETGASGVEVRKEGLDLTANLVYPRAGALPAVGWNRDAETLDATLHLPPGWTLIAAPGADVAAGSWAERWNLLRLFFLLLAALATWKLSSWRWGLVALVGLGLSWFEPFGTQLWVSWLVVLIPVALLRVAGQGRFARLVRVLHWSSVGTFLVVLALFVSAQWRTGLFPHLDESDASRAVPLWSDASTESGFVASKAAVQRSEYASSFEAPFARARQVDANAVAQTGPARPSWSWRSHALTWSGPVSAQHELRLWLLSPTVELLLSWLRIGLALLLPVGALGLRGRLRPAAWNLPPEPGEPERLAVGAALLVGIVLASGAANAVSQDGAAAPAPPDPAAVAAPAVVPPGPVRDLLSELEERLTRAPACNPECVEVPRLELSARQGTLTIRAEVHAAVDTGWPLPGPAESWLPSSVRVDGRETTALRSGERGFLFVRLERGVHRVELSGPARDLLALEFGLVPRSLGFAGQGFRLNGFRPDAPPPASVELVRSLPESAAGLEQGAELAAWLEVTRELDLGIPWLVHTEVRRVSEATGPVSLAVPLLPGERPTSGEVAVAGLEALVALERDETSRRWTSTLDEAAELILRASSGRPFSEVWKLRCSPIWNCQASGLPPVQHVEGGEWLPMWRPWPGETLTLSLRRPEAAAGATLSRDQVLLSSEPGRRLRQSKLKLGLRSSRANVERLELPASAVLESLTVDGQAQTVQLSAGVLSFPIAPGSHEVEISFREDLATGLFERLPEVKLAGPVSNVRLELQVPRNRWLLWAGGPRWGSVVTLWIYLPVLLLAAWVLARFAPTPLRFVEWLLLGLGLTQLPVELMLVVVAWFLAFATRGRWKSRRWQLYSLQQLGLTVLWLSAMVALFATVYGGLLGQPRMEVVGGLGNGLAWYADQAAESLPGAYALWLPLWVFRVLMLAWALWLSARLVKWIPWAWGQLASGPLLAGPKSQL